MGTLKTSYTIPCSSDFRDAVLALAEARGVNAADLARSVLLLLPLPEIDSHPDPGGPLGDDRETITLQTGKFAGRPWRRKPRLQLRLPPGLAQETIRKALKLALLFGSGTKEVSVTDPAALRASHTIAAPPAPSSSEGLDALGLARLSRLEDEVERLKSVVEVLSFEPLPSGITSRSEALYVLGFPPYSDPDARELRSRFRMLAAIHHPDSAQGDHRRMSQLNAAMDLLRSGG